MTKKSNITKRKSVATTNVGTKRKNSAMTKNSVAKTKKQKIGSVSKYVANTMTNKDKISSVSKYVANSITNKDKIRFNELLKSILNDFNAKHDMKILTVMKPADVKDYIWGKDNLTGNMRQYIEPVTADEQCKRAGLVFDENTSQCWLCGCVIGKQKKACEHILPALRAVMLTGMITTKQIMNREHFANANDELLTEITRKNYLWAHDDCNGSSGKSGIVLIKLDEQTHTFVPDKDNCNLLNVKIKKIPREDCYKKKNADPKYTNIYNRLEKEMEEQCVAINEELQEFKKIDPQHFMDIYIEYTLNIIKLYANTIALEALLTPEEMMKRNLEKEEQIKKLLEEQQTLKDLCEKNYIQYLSQLMHYNQKAVNYTNAREVPVELIVRLHCSNFLSRRMNTLNNVIKYEPPKEIKIITDNVTSQIVPVIENIFSQISTITTEQKLNTKIPVAFIYSIIDFLTVALVYKETSSNQLTMRINEKILKDNEMNSFLCDLLHVILIKIKDHYYTKTSHETFFKEYQNNPLFIYLLNLFNAVGIDTQRCENDVVELNNDYLRNLNQEFMKNEKTPEVVSLISSPMNVVKIESAEQNKMSVSPFEKKHHLNNKVVTFMDREQMNIDSQIKSRSPTGKSMKIQNRIVSKNTSYNK